MNPNENNNNNNEIQRNLHHTCTRQDREMVKERERKTKRNMKVINIHRKSYNNEMKKKIISSFPWELRNMGIQSRTTRLSNQTINYSLWLLFSSERKKKMKK